MFSIRIIHRTFSPLLYTGVIEKCRRQRTQERYIKTVFSKSFASLRRNEHRLSPISKFLKLSSAKSRGCLSRQSRSPTIKVNTKKRSKRLRNNIVHSSRWIASVNLGLAPQNDSRLDNGSW